MTTPDNKPTSPREILETSIRAISRDDDPNVTPTIDAIETAIAAYYEGLIPEKRKLYEPVTKREVKEDETVTIDLLMDKKGSLVFIQDNGFNQAIHIFHRNFTGQTDNERKQ